MFIFIIKNQLLFKGKSFGVKILFKISLFSVFHTFKSDINLTKNSVMHSKTKHIDIRHHFLMNHVLKGDVEITFIKTHDPLVDIFTKSLAKEQFYKIIRELWILYENDI